MQARRDEVKHMKHRHLGYYDNIKHAVKVRRSAPPELLRSSGAVPLPLLFRSPLLRATALGMGEGRDLAPGCTGNYLVLVVGGGELGSSAAGGSGGGGELAPDPGGASACGEGCFGGQLPAGSATGT